MLRITIDDSSLRQTRTLGRQLTQARHALENRRRPHQEIKKRMVTRWTANFDAQGGLYGDWVGLSSRTIAERRSLGIPDGPILVRTGTLRSGFIGQANKGVVSRNATEWNFARQPHYLYTHQFGGPFGTARVPARRMWGVNDEDERLATEALEAYVTDVIRRYFR